MDLQFGDIQETALITLAIRASETARPNARIRDQKAKKIIDGMKCHTVEEIESALKNAGFSKVKSGHHKSKPWITVVAQK